MQLNLENVASGLLALAAVCVIVSVGKREVRGTSRYAGVDEGRTFYPQWRSLDSVGRRIGSPNARVTLTVFSDLECPFCRRLHERYERLASAFPEDVAMNFIHYPIGSHRFAVPAARAAECASRQGRFAQFVSVVFHSQDSLGLKSWR